MPKLLPPRPDREGQGRFRPDLIVHSRQDDTCNLLVVEWKKNADELTLQCLEERVRSLLGPNCYSYQIGVLIRAWAKDQGIAVSDRGRIPASVLERYLAAAKRR